MKKKILIGLGVIILLFIITNPTPSDFKTYLEGKFELHSYAYGQLANENGHVGYGRTSNYLIFSIYTTRQEKNYTEFIGVFKNFIPLK